jgi:hypothetical protein
MRDGSDFNSQKNMRRVIQGGRARMTKHEMWRGVSCGQLAEHSG